MINNHNEQVLDYDKDFIEFLDNKQNALSAFEDLINGVPYDLRRDIFVAWDARNKKTTQSLDNTIFHMSFHIPSSNASTSALALYKKYQRKLPELINERTKIILGNEQEYNLTFKVVLPEEFSDRDLIYHMIEDGEGETIYDETGFTFDLIKGRGLVEKILDAYSKSEEAFWAPEGVLMDVLREDKDTSILGILKNSDYPVGYVKDLMGGQPLSVLKKPTLLEIDNLLRGVGTSVDEGQGPAFEELIQQLRKALENPK